MSGFFEPAEPATSRCAEPDALRDAVLAWVPGQIPNATRFRGDEMNPSAAAKRKAGPGPRFRHILVPSDLTERTEKALQLARTLAEADTCRITLLHVIETIDGLPFDELKPFYSGLERKARSALSKLASSVDGTQTAAEVVYGRRAEEVVRFAIANEADLIVLASHRVNPSAVDRDWGTISYKVGILAQCPVLLVK
jgi:universal stress protein A